MKGHLDFIVIGGQRSGTTSLFEYMRAHPELFIPPAKEVPYFSHVEYREDWTEYMRRWFGDADGDRLWGTVTPQYMMGGLYRQNVDSEGALGDPHAVPARIREQLPDVRLIAILRDPVERARSHYGWAADTGWEKRSFAEAITEILRPEALTEARARPAETNGYVTWGEYGRLLSPYFDLFPADRILVTYTSELESDPAAVMRGIFRFLKVADDYVPEDLGAVYRATAQVPRRFSRLRLEAMKDVLAAKRPARRVWHLIPAPARTTIDQRFGRLDYWVDTLNRRYPRNEFPHERAQPRRLASADSGVEEVLRAHYEADARLLTSLVGAPPPWAHAAPAAN